MTKNNGSKVLNFSEALKSVKPKRVRAGSTSTEFTPKGSRFVETGEGLTVERAEKATAKPKTSKPKMVPIADLLLEEMERQEDEAAAKKPKKD